MHSHFLYIGGPYTSTCQAICEYRERMLMEAAYKFMSLDVPVFSPITHSVPPAQMGLPNDPAFWRQMNKPFINACTALVVVMLDGWAGSMGLEHEIEMFEEAASHITAQAAGAFAAAEETFLIGSYCENFSRCFFAKSRQNTHRAERVLRKGQNISIFLRRKCSSCK